MLIIHHTLHNNRKKVLIVQHTLENRPKNEILSYTRKKASQQTRFFCAPGTRTSPLCGWFECREGQGCQPSICI